MNVTERHYTKAVDAVSQAAMRKVSKGIVCEVEQGAPIETLAQLCVRYVYDFSADRLKKLLG
ncbi:MAG: hypothetical protein WCA38_00435 [Candidatus Acidiferrales bacterium]